MQRGYLFSTLAIIEQMPVQFLMDHGANPTQNIREEIRKLHLKDYYYLHGLIMEIVSRYMAVVTALL